MHFSGSSQNGSGSQRQAGPGGEKFCGVRNEGRQETILYFEMDTSMLVLTLMSERITLLQCCIINFTQQNCWQLQLVKLTLQQLQHDQANLNKLDIQRSDYDIIFEILKLALP